MQQTYVVVGKLPPRVDLVGVQGTDKFFKVTLKPKVFGGQTLDLTGCIVNAAIKRTKADTTKLVELSSVLGSTNLITVQILPASTTEDLRSVISFKLTPQQTRLLKMDEKTKRNCVWAMEYIDTLGSTIALFYGECIFSEEIV